MKTRAMIYLTLILFLLGMAISMQFKTQQQILNSLAYQDSRDLITIYHSMKDKEEELSTTLEELRQRRSALAFEAARGEELIIQARNEIEQLQVISGDVPVTGPGITITITRDAPIMHYDLIDLLNELWVSGAEAIAINEHRVTFTTSIQLVSAEDILINGEKLLFPCIVRAIGDPQTLEKGLTFTGGLVENWRLLYGIYPTIAQRESIALPATNQ